MEAMIQKIISGGQTGADRAALDFAIQHNIPHGGWIPKGRKAEDGTLSEKYHLQEMPTGSYSKQTEKNILDSDGTLIVSPNSLCAWVWVNGLKPDLLESGNKGVQVYHQTTIKAWLCKGRVLRWQSETSSTSW